MLLLDTFLSKARSNHNFIYQYDDHIFEGYRLLSNTYYFFPVLNIPVLKIRLYWYCFETSSEYINWIICKPRFHDGILCNMLVVKCSLQNIFEAFFHEISPNKMMCQFKQVIKHFSTILTNLEYLLNVCDSHQYKHICSFKCVFLTSFSSLYHGIAVLNMSIP